MTEGFVTGMRVGLERQKAIPQKKLENKGENREIAAGPGRGGSYQEQEQGG